MTRTEATNLLLEKGLSEADLDLLLIDLGERDDYDPEEVEDWALGMSNIDRLERIFNMEV